MCLQMEHNTESYMMISKTLLEAKYAVVEDAQESHWHEFLGLWLWREPALSMEE